MAQDFQDYVEKEFAEVQKARGELLAKRKEIDEQLLELENRLDAAQTYKAMRERKLRAPESRTRRTREAPAARGRRGSREQLKGQIVDLVRQHPQGLAADQINRSLNVTDPKQKQQVANVLSLLKKDGVLRQEQRRGPYTASA
jgi:(p)ppGpp synthase/HD superfamily hydrolase